MPELDDDDSDGDSPAFSRYVEKHVTLDMLSTEEIVQELVDRQRLIVVTARRRVPRTIYSKPKFYSAIQALLSCDLAKHLVEGNRIGEDIVQREDDLEFHATIVVLTTKEERPI